MNMQRGLFTPSLVVVLLLMLSVMGHSVPLSAESAPYRPLFDKSQLSSEYFTGALRAPFEQLIAGNPDKALKALGDHPHSSAKRGDSKALLLAALATQSIGDDTRAIALLSRFLSDHPADSDARYFLAASLAKSGRLPEALSALEEAVWFSRGSLVPPAIVQLELAALYQLNGRYAEAKKILDKLAAQPDPSADTFLALGELAASQGDHAQAIIHLRKATELDSESTEAKLALVRALMQRSGGKVRAVAAQEAKRLCDELSAAPLSSAETQEVRFASLEALIELGSLEEAQALHSQLARDYRSDPRVAAFAKQLEIEHRGAAAQETPAQDEEGGNDRNTDE